MTKAQILLTNDDGIHSPGLWAAAGALESLGYVTVAAPREQSSGTGRSMPTTSDGIISSQTIRVNGRDWNAYAVGGTPAQAILHGVLEIIPTKPDLVVSGINYGENVGTGITVSGTVGAALEGAALGIPSLAVSLETPPEHHLTHSTEIDFSAAAHFVTLFGNKLLEQQLPEDVDLLKIEIPSNASPTTPWEITALSRIRYYQTLRPERESWDQPTKIGYTVSKDWRKAPEHTDVYALHGKRIVSVTPLSLDLTSRLKLEDLDRLLRGKN